MAKTYKVGSRFRLTRDVDRFPHFIAVAGMTGTLDQFDREMILLKMDDLIEGCEEWNNCVEWSSNMGDIEQFADDAEPLISSL